MSTPACSLHACPLCSHPTLHRCPQEANYYGSLTQAGTVSLGLDAEGKEVFVPFHALLPMVSPDDLVLDGGRGPGPGGGWGRGLRGAPSCRTWLSLSVAPRLGHILPESGGGHAARAGARLGAAGTAVAAHGDSAPEALRLHPRVHRSQPERACGQPHPWHARAAGAALAPTTNCPSPCHLFPIRPMLSSFCPPAPIPRALASTGDLYYLPLLPSWSRSVGTSATSGPARSWTKSLCCGQQTRSASAN